MDGAPGDVVADLDHAARRMRTPCGAGTMVWRCWGEGTRLVLLHGGAGSWRHWIRNISPLARHCQIWAPDTPGLGSSDLPPAPVTSGGIAAIIGAGLDRLLGPDARYHLCGFSFGGLLSAELAALHGDRVRSLTLVGSGGMGGGRGSVTLEKVRSRHGADRIAAHRANLARLMIFDPARIDATALAIQTWNSDHARLNSRVFHEQGRLPEVIANVHVPLNGIWGEYDASAGGHLADREATLRRLRPDIDFRRIPNAGHWVAYEAAEHFNEMLLDMLALR